MKNQFSINKTNTLLEVTDSSTDYNRILKYELSFCGETMDSHCPFWLCDCPNHRRYWTMRAHRGVKQYYNRQRSWKKHRKTQYKTLE